MKKIILFFILAVFLFADSLFAASGIGVRPLRTNISLDPGASGSIYLTIINNEDFTQVVKPEFQTYTSHNEQGYPIAKQLEEDDPQNIISWISFEKEKISVPPKSEKKVKVTISVPETAEPGGRYGALIYGPILTDTSGVAFRTRVASLLLLDVKGDEKYDGEVSGFGIKDQEMYSDKGIQFAVDFENKGNIHVGPKGKISIYDKDGKKVESVFSILDKDGEEMILNDIPVNPFLNYTLPGLKRVYESDWKMNVAEGKYTAKLDLLFKKGDDQFTENKEVEFEIRDNLNVENFNFSEEDGKTYFILKLNNNGTVNEKIQGTIDVLNNLDYKIGEIKIPEDVGYITPGQAKEFKLKFLDKEMPDGDYTVKSNITYGYAGKKLDLNKEFSFNNNLVIYIIGILALLILLLILVWRKKKIKELIKKTEK